jgi:TPR repeat protein
MGDHSAQFELARGLWEADTGNRAEALGWYLRAAESGNPQYQMAYGLVLCWNAKDSEFKEGFKWILKAAEQGDTGAQYFAAVEYATGEHIDKDYPSAAALYQRASDAGHPEARYNLGIMYWNGEGVSRNPDKARELLLAAAQDGELLALRAVSEGYTNGAFGFAVNRSRAKYWRDKYQIAAR